MEEIERHFLVMAETLANFVPFLNQVKGMSDHRDCRKHGLAINTARFK
jgi:hypothetical protein